MARAAEANVCSVCACARTVCGGGSLSCRGVVITVRARGHERTDGRDGCGRARAHTVVFTTTHCSCTVSVFNNSIGVYYLCYCAADDLGVETELERRE